MNKLYTELRTAAKPAYWARDADMLQAKSRLLLHRNCELRETFPEERLTHTAALAKASGYSIESASLSKKQRFGAGE
jgi:hypothetical protein